MGCNLCRAQATYVNVGFITGVRESRRVGLAKWGAEQYFVGVGLANLKISDL
jgi:hypothetical protein